jgi:hypothetical protein
VYSRDRLVTTSAVASLNALALRRRYDAPSPSLVPGDRAASAQTAIRRLVVRLVAAYRRTESDRIWLRALRVFAAHLRGVRPDADPGNVSRGRSRNLPCISTSVQLLSRCSEH